MRHFIYCVWKYKLNELITCNICIEYCKEILFDDQGSYLNAFAVLYINTNINRPLHKSEF
jgi:hypothetical protein